MMLMLMMEKNRMLSLKGSAVRKRPIENSMEVNTRRTNRIRKMKKISRLLRLASLSSTWACIFPSMGGTVPSSVVSQK